MVAGELVISTPSTVGPGPTGFADGRWTEHVCPPKKKKVGKAKATAPTMEASQASSSSTSQPRHDFAYYGITVCPTEGEILDELSPVLTDSDESSDDFAEEVNQTFLNQAALVSTMPGDPQMPVVCELVVVQSAPITNEASDNQMPLDVPMEEQCMCILFTPLVVLESNLRHGNPCLLGPGTILSHPS
jgi:hypothetical protein